MKKMIIASIFVAIALAGCGLTNNKEENKNEEAINSVISIEDAKVKALDFIENNLLEPGMKLEFKDIIEEDSLYKLIVTVDDSEDIESYITKDGENFIPSMMNIEEVHAKNHPEQNIVKNEKPSVELFVMSHCPYGTQIEKGILPVLETLGDKIDFELKFCDYAMHAKKEIDEQTRQYCIQKEENDKLIDYLTCFLDADDSDGCITKTNINKTNLDSCVAATDKEYKITENFNNKSTWQGQFPSYDVYKEDNVKYGIQGSPSLVINGNKVSSGRDAASLLSIICSGFANPPAECGAELSSTVPAPGFGFDGSGSASSGSCN